MTNIEIYSVKELTPEQKKIVKETIPILKQAGEALTTQFYQNMFNEYPQVKIYFDSTNQKNLRQPKILAFALLKYAENIDDLSPLVDFVKQIVSKHVGLQIKPQHYPYVGNALIGTMGQLLGSTATKEFIDAWTQAYGNLAQLLINMENEAYKLQAWDGFKDFKVEKIVDECNNVKSVYFKPVDGKISKGLPGQYITIRFNVGEEYPIARSYSISNVDDCYRISVKKIGKISNFIHDNLKIGDEVTITPPSGNFVFENSDDIHHFVIGGIGITPVLPMLKELLPKGEKAVLHYSNKTGDRPFVDTLKTWKQQYDNFTVVEYITQSENVDDRIDQVNFRKIDKSDLQKIKGQVYLLGPVPFMMDIKSVLLEKGIEPKVEFFGPMVV